MVLAVVVLVAAAASFLNLPLRCSQTGRRSRGRGGRGWHRRLLDQEELGGRFGIGKAVPTSAPRQGAMEKLLRSRLYHQEVVSGVLCEQKTEPE